MIYLFCLDTFYSHVQTYVENIKQNNNFEIVIESNNVINDKMKNVFEKENDYIFFILATPFFKIDNINTYDKNRIFIMNIEKL